MNKREDYRSQETARKHAEKCFGLAGYQTIKDIYEGMPVLEDIARLHVAFRAASRAAELTFLAARSLQEARRLLLDPKCAEVFGQLDEIGSRLDRYDKRPPPTVNAGDLGETAERVEYTRAVVAADKMGEGYDLLNLLSEAFGDPSDLVGHIDAAHAEARLATECLSTAMRGDAANATHLTEEGALGHFSKVALVRAAWVALHDDIRVMKQKATAWAYLSIALGMETPCEGGSELEGNLKSVDQFKCRVKNSWESVLADARKGVGETTGPTRDR